MCMTFSYFQSNTYIAFLNSCIFVFVHVFNKFCNCAHIYYKIPLGVIIHSFILYSFFSLHFAFALSLIVIMHICVVRATFYIYGKSYSAKICSNDAKVYKVRRTSVTWFSFDPINVCIPLYALSCKFKKNCTWSALDIEYLFRCMDHFPKTVFFIALFFALSFSFSLCLFVCFLILKSVPQLIWMLNTNLRHWIHMWQKV